MNKTTRKGNRGKAKDAIVNSEISAADKTIETDAGHIDQIRDIIFGRQMSDYDKRFKELEDRVNNQIDRLSTDADEKLKAIRNDIHDQYETLSKLLQSEKAERDQDSNAFSTALDVLSDRLKEEIKQLGGQLMEMSGQLSDEMQNQQMEAAKNLEDAFQKLDKAKLARGTLSELLKEMADRISNRKK